MRLAIRAFCKIILLPVLFTTVLIGYVNAESSPKTPVVSKSPTVSKVTQDVVLEFYTTYDSDAKCDQRNFGFTWQDVKNDLARYDIGMNKIDWLFAPSICTQVVNPNYNHVVITEFRDKNSPLHVYYIHHTKKDKHILLKVDRDDWLQPISNGKYQYFGDIDSFSEGKFVLEQYVYASELY